MPKTKFPLEAIAFSIRLPMHLAEFLQWASMQTGSVNAAIRQILEDAHSLYGLPEVLTAQLDAEAKELGKGRRDYIIHLLSQHAAELLKSGKYETRAGKKK